MKARLAHAPMIALLAGLWLGCPEEVIDAPSGDDDDDDNDDVTGDEPPNPLELAAEVDGDELSNTIADLEGFGTRYTFSDGDDQARDYLEGRLEELGLSPELDTFEVQGEIAANVIARKEGLERPDIVYMFSAHYDSTSENPQVSAPGADDNASAVAAVLEAARILAPLDTKYSLWFVLTAAEEQGSVGSAHMVDWLAADGVDIQGVIAPDMIGYWPLGDDDSMDILGDEGSRELADQMAAMAVRLGVSHKIWIQHSYCYGDDHTNFQEAGYPAISPMDCVEAHNVPASGETLPHYHRTSDTLDTLHMDFTTRVTQVLVGTFAELGEPLGE
ncbi:MAG: M20/M25/M40 family metallo-hydrolase [Myxococcota bacterium]|jgi:hypothetical protein|nr:M20/M25/M40 family metallo-hydrolase [Myxococcota bacterium]